MKIKFLSLIILSAITYSQCDLNTELECENNNQCDWIEDIDYGSCSSLSSLSLLLFVTLSAALSVSTPRFASA